MRGKCGRGAAMPLACPNSLPPPPQDGLCVRASTSCCNCSASTAHQTHLLLLHTYSPIHTAASVDVALACASESLADGGLWSNLGDVRASLTTGCAEECEVTNENLHHELRGSDDPRRRRLSFQTLLSLQSTHAS